MPKRILISAKLQNAKASIFSSYPPFSIMDLPMQISSSSAPTNTLKLWIMDTCGMLTKKQKITLPAKGKETFVAYLEDNLKRYPL